MDVCVARVNKFFFGKNEGLEQKRYRLSSQTTAVLFDPRTDLLPKANMFCGAPELCCPVFAGFLYYCIMDVLFQDSAKPRGFPNQHFFLYKAIYELSFY